MSITIAPPLFQLNLQPGETWTSVIAVVNDNPYNMTLYADPVLFKPSGESGSPVFIAPPSTDAGEIDSSTLAGWITVPEGAIDVAREQTYSLPITISVPQDASPGGHYAAVLIGNHAPDGEAEGSTVSVTSSIAALVFLTVSGDVIEKGRIRDFVTEKTLYEKAEAHFSLRFENQGNVHLIPQGSIIIYNMFGKERGNIPINHHKDYGNVLPESVRKFTFSWTSDIGIWDIGRYKAEATIGYGKDMKQTALASTYFYVLPIIPLLEIIIGLGGSILFIGWALRAYIRRALAIETARIHHKSKDESHSLQKRHTPALEPKLKVGTLVRPIQAGMVDLRKAGGKKVSSHGHSVRKKGEVDSPFSFIAKYRAFFIFMLIGGMLVCVLSMYFEDVMTTTRDYSAAEIRPDGSTVEL